MSRVDTELAQIYEIPGFLSEPECNRIIAAINANLRPSNATGFEGARTSRTCDLWRFEPGLNQELDCKIAKMMGVDRRYSEPIQGQRYDQGEFLKAHTDFFSDICRCLSAACCSRWSTNMDGDDLFKRCSRRRANRIS